MLTKHGCLMFAGFLSFANQEASKYPNPRFTSPRIKFLNQTIPLFYNNMTSLTAGFIPLAKIITLSLKIKDFAEASNSLFSTRIHLTVSVFCVCPTLVTVVLLSVPSALHLIPLWPTAANLPGIHSFLCLSAYFNFVCVLWTWNHKTVCSCNLEGNLQTTHLVDAPTVTPALRY